MTEKKKMKEKQTDKQTDRQTESQIDRQIVVRRNLKGDVTQEKLSRISNRNLFLVENVSFAKKKFGGKKENCFFLFSFSSVRRADLTRRTRRKNEEKSEFGRQQKCEIKDFANADFGINGAAIKKSSSTRRCQKK